MPDLVFLLPRFEIYRAVSRQIHSIFADYTPLIEPLSLDEAYLDVTENLRGISKASGTAAEIRARIFDETGLTASAGISYNKFLAKLASDRRQYVVTPAMGATFVEALPVGEFHGVGPVTANKMNRLGIFTGADLRRQSLAFLHQHFDKVGPWYRAIANGEDHRPVVPGRRASPRDRKRPSPTTDPADIEGWRAGDGGRGLGLVRPRQTNSSEVWERVGARPCPR
jgi:DNA polymerase-4